MLPFAESSFDGGDLVWVLVVVLLIVAIVALLRGRL